MIKRIKEISVFFPTYNESKIIKKVVNNAAKVLNRIAVKWELIIINDGSKDETLLEVNKLASRDKRIKVINHKTNLGYGAALKSGFYNSKFKWIVFTDSDGQFDFTEVVKFINEQRKSNADLVVGYYKKREVSKFKIITSKIWEFIVFILFGLKIKDIDCGFKLISKKVLDGIPKLESERGAFISSELLIKAKDKGFKIVEIPVTHYPRKVGSGTGRHLNVILKSFLDLLKLKIKLIGSGL